MNGEVAVAVEDWKGLEEPAGLKGEEIEGAEVAPPKGEAGVGKLDPKEAAVDPNGVGVGWDEPKGVGAAELPPKEVEEVFELPNDDEEGAPNGLEVLVVEVKGVG